MKCILLQFWRSEVRNESHRAKMEVSAELPSSWMAWGRIRFLVILQMEKRRLKGINDFVQGHIARKCKS